MKEIIKKIDAAQRQLDFAIKLWFQGTDTISTHTSVCSAHQIIHDINQNSRDSHLLFNSVYIKSDRRQYFISILKKSYNFFKHANRDPDPEGIIEFDPSLTEFFILFTILGIEALGYNLNISSKIFLAYFAIHNTSFFTAEGLKFFLKNVPIETIDKVRSIDRNQFFKGLFGSLKRISA